MTSIDQEVVSGSSAAKRVLVTGATGFIGQHCLHYLVAHRSWMMTGR